jgi:hypothetical protein
MPLPLADTANDALFELVPYLLNLRAQGATRCGGFHLLRPLVIGTRRVGVDGTGAYGAVVIPTLCPIGSNET